MKRVVVGGLVAVVLAGCGAAAPANVGGNDALPAALEMWAAFPVNASPRPLVIAGTATEGPRGVYGDSDVKLAVAGGAFDRPTHFPAGPTTADGYPIISADRAFDLLKPKAPVTGTRTRLTVTDIRLGKGTFGTDRGNQTLPAWLFSFARVDGPIAVLAVAPAAQWFPAELAGREGQPYWTGVVVRIDHKTLTVSFIGAQSESGPCGVRYEAKLTESPTAVMVTRISYPNDPKAVCTLVGFIRRASAVLNAPLGARVLVDDLGYPMGVTDSP